VSYHETADPVNKNETDINADDNSHHPNLEIIESNDTGPVDDTIDNSDNNDIHVPHVSFNATVMASVIAEASAEADEDKFIGGSFTQLQDVDDVYEDNDPDVVVCAHIIDTNHLDYEYVHCNNPSSNGLPNPHRDFELILHHTSQRVNNKDGALVVHYVRNRPDLVSHEYNSPCSGSIIDYAGAMRLKLKLAGIHNSTDLMAIFEGRTDADASNVFKTQLNDIDQKGFKTSTVRLLKEETVRHAAHAEYNSIRESQMI
jgi:hypothetical protein